MNKQKFVVADWLPTENVRIPLTVIEKNYEMNTQNDPEPVSMADLELVTSRIEAAKIDLTASRGNWIKLGIAFANSLGENGRSYFQRICVFYPGYSSSECDSQYNKCLKTENKRTNISTFFFLAKQVGIDINPQRKVGKLGCRPSLPEDPTGTSAEDETEPIDDKTNTDSGKQESTNTDHTSLILALIQEYLSAFPNYPCHHSI